MWENRVQAFYCSFGPLVTLYALSVAWVEMEGVSNLELGASEEVVVSTPPAPALPGL